METVATRAFTSRKTLQCIEEGDYGVSIGIHASVLNALGLLDGLAILVTICFAPMQVCFGEPLHSASASNDDWNRSWDIHVMAHDHDKWSGAMRKLRSRVIDEVGSTDPEALHKLV